MKTVAEPFQLPAQSGVVVDLAVKGDDRVAVVADDGLIASAEVDDLEADSAQRYAVRLKNALLIGAAMKQRVRNAAGDTLTLHTASMRKTRYPAHSDIKSPKIP